MRIKPDPISKVDAGGVFKGPLTFPCPECGVYHASMKSAFKCLKKVSIKLDAITSYYRKLQAAIAENKQ